MPNTRSPELRPDTLRRFWAKVNRGPGCWLWTAGTDTNGYGLFGWREDGVKHQWGAHRLMWVLTHGLIPEGMHVCHACDVPLCVNPEHLWLGTHRANMVDKSRKGRARGGAVTGERNHGAKVTAAEVREIRERVAAGETQAAMCREFGLSPMGVSDIVNRKNWAHVA